MERKKNILIALFISLLLPAFGQINQTIYKSYISGNMVEWKKYMDSYKSITNAEKLDLINYQYGYIAYCIDQDKKSEAEKYLQKAENLIADLEKQQYNLSMIYAYKAAFVGFKIGLSPYKAPFIGNQSLIFAKKSIALDGNNFLGYIQLGNIAFYTPSIFGGSKTDALSHYKRALELMEKKPDCIKYNWNYLNLLSAIINNYYELKQFDLAKKYCIKTLAFEPEFDWVKNQLYPKILKQKNNE
jgi:tetratricopeptide (TPR) repeat protein